MGPTATALSRDQALSRPHPIIIITMDTIILLNLGLCLRALNLDLSRDLSLCLRDLVLQKK